MEFEELVGKTIYKWSINKNKTIVSEEILEKEFVCNLSACQGACCVDGDAGAPLDEEETKILAEIFPKVKPLIMTY